MAEAAVVSSSGLKMSVTEKFVRYLGLTDMTLALKGYPSCTAAVSMVASTQKRTCAAKVASDGAADELGNRMHRRPNVLTKEWLTSNKSRACED